MSITEAAVFLAQQWPVFACQGNKSPLTENGFKDAVSDEASIRAMFRRPGAAMIGVPTGAISGFVVVDLDVKEGRFGLEWLAANEHRIPRTRRHGTQSGGLHLLFQAPPGRRIRNSASKIAPGVDVRGDGGYVIVPPSPGYAIQDDTMPAEMPGWLLELLDPPAPAPPPAAPRREIVSGDGSKYGLSALDSECEAIMAAPFGQQETTLNAACLKIGALVAGGEIAADVALSLLTSAALGMASQPGKDAWHPGKLREKVRNAFADGQRQPRQAPPLLRRTVEEYAPQWPEPPPYDAPPDHWQAEAEPDMPAPATKQEALRTPRILPVVMFADAQAKLDANDFVEGVLSRQAMSVIYGESNSGKTFFALDLGLHVAAGRQWRDRAVEQGLVLYLALEGSAAIMNRVAAFKIEQGMDGDHIPFAIAPVAVNLLDPEADAAAVIDTVRAVAAAMEAKPMLVIVDTLARAIAGGNENASEDMGALVRNGDLIREETGAHLMWIHHSGKDQAKGARGHSSLRAATDTEIEVVAVNANRTATVTKQRDMECSGSFAFSLKVVDLGNNTRGKAVTSCVVEYGEGDEEAAAPSRRRFTGDQQMALRILHDTLAEVGEPDFPGVPGGVRSIPEDWWRDRFYNRAKPGADMPTKQKSFRRAADALVSANAASTNRGRVWAL